MPSDPPEKSAEIDERFLDEWIEFGLAEIVSYLTKHANFDAWCVEHGQEGVGDG